MSLPPWSTPGLEEAVEAFLAGLVEGDLEPAAYPTDPAYRTRGEDGPLEVTYPLRTLNGDTIARPIPDHMVVVRANVTTPSMERLQTGLRELTVVVEDFLAGMDRKRHSSRDPDDHRGWNTGAVIGFGPTFFRDRETGEPRFPFPLVPKQLDFLRLEGDDRFGVDPVSTQADLVIAFESQSYTLAMSGYDHVVEYVRRTEWLDLVDVVQGVTRGDGRNHLGFYDGVRNPTLDSTPSLYDVTMVRPPDEAPALESGSYMVHRRYSFDLERWAAAADEQEEIVGIHKESGADRVPMARGSHVGKAVLPNAPHILRRGVNYAEIRDDQSLDTGLLFISFQRSPEQFVTLYDHFLYGTDRGPPDRLLTGGMVRPSTADLYFVPDYIGWGYAGHVFFEPDAFARLYQGGAQARGGAFTEALATYRGIVRDHPHFLPAYTNISDLAPDEGLIEETEARADQALALDPDHFLGLNVKAWACYLHGDYPRATQFARRAIEASYVDSFRAFPYHTLGASLIELGRFAEAEAALRRSAIRVNVEPLICYSLGNSLDAQGRDAEAEKIYARTLEVVEYRLRYGQVSARDRRNLFHMRYVRYRSPRSRSVFEAVRRLVSASPNTYGPAPQGPGAS
ncbi:MAG: Dyp-type peroxidase [Gemmatimonadetes bacterium]|nr:Dyp-type peroxidase [Gemmatimonadota bacterium]